MNSNNNANKRHPKRGGDATFEDKTFIFRDKLALLDAVIVISAQILSIIMHDVIFQSKNELNILSNLSILPFSLLLLSVFLYKYGAYKPPRESSNISYVVSISKSVVASFSILITLLLILNIKYIDFDILKLFIAIVWLLLLSSRIVVSTWYRKISNSGKNQLEILIIGTGNRAKFLAATLQEKTDWGINIIGYLDVDKNLVGETINGKKVLGVLDDIHEVMKSNVIDEVIIAIPRAMISNMERIALACEEEGVCLRVMADFFEMNVARIRLVEMGNIPLLTLEPIAHDDMKLLIKRIMDFVITLVAMPFFLPVMLAIAITIKMDSPGPAFFTQQRVGKNKRQFKMYKFRSMVVDSEKMIKQLEHLNEAEGPIFKIANDPRITRVGRFIRKTSLDELPQLFNVLLGEMSLVGPRPMSIRDVDLFDKGIQRKRFSMKPGITCLWQISGRSNLPFEKWLELDLEYIENWSLLNDMKILVKTIPVVVYGSGAV